MSDETYTKADGEINETTSDDDLNAGNDDNTAALPANDDENVSQVKKDDDDQCPEIIVEEEEEEEGIVEEKKEGVEDTSNTICDNLDSNCGDEGGHSMIIDEDSNTEPNDDTGDNNDANDDENEEEDETNEIDSKIENAETKSERESKVRPALEETNNVQDSCNGLNSEEEVPSYGVTPQKSNKTNDKNNNDNNSNSFSANNIYDQKGEKSFPRQTSNTPSLNSIQSPNKLLNKFASWKSKADAVIQSSEVLKAAQKSIEEKTKEVQQAMKNNLSKNPNSHQHNSAKKSQNQTHDQPNDFKPSSIDGDIASPRLKSYGTEKMNDDVKTTNDDNEAPLLNRYVENDEQSKQSRLTLEEDDFSYDSRDASEKEDSESEQSSIFVDTDDAFSQSTYSSDQSSIKISSPPRRINNRLVAYSSPKRLGASSSAPSPTRSSPAKPSTALGSGTKVKSDENPLVDRQLFNFEDVKIKRTANKTTSAKILGTSSKDEVVNSVTKGRYSQTVSRPAILQQLRKVRVPSPPPVPESSSSSSILTSNAQRTESAEEAKDKQMTRIRRYLGPQVMEAMSAKLSTGEYLMYLGPGMLGVNLKQTFLKGHGVYIDFVVPGGNAHKSEVIWIGDRLVKVGNTDVSKGTIYDVPGTIANMKRPIIMVLNGDHDVEWEKMDNLAVAIAMINKIQNDSKKDVNYTSMTNIDHQPIGKSVMPPSPSKHARKSLQSFVRKRCNEITSFSALSFACKNDEGLQLILSAAFMTCCIDNRRLPFLAAFISNEDSHLGNGEVEPQVNSGSITGSTRLMLLLELISFRDLFGVTPPHRRLEAAQRIAHKFFLPKANEISPQFDIRSMIPSDTIHAIEARLKKEEISYNMYGDIEQTLRDSFGGMKFASFLLSDECARMRAYMRGTSPYLQPDLHCLFKASQNPYSESFSSARNHLVFMMVYLLCQSQSDAFDINYSTRDLNLNKNDRVMGATGGICCAIFVEKVLIPSINNAKAALLKNQINEIDSMGQTLIESYSQFWEVFIAPSGGTLEHTPLSNETQTILDKVRRSVSLAASPPRNFTRKERRRHFVQSLSLNADLTNSLQRLKEELIYDYSVNAHPKYRGHTIHEWMCGEVNKASYTQLDTSDTTETPANPELSNVPLLPPGSITRLFRRLELPDGLSRHCPEIQTAADSKQNGDEDRKNADYHMVVFGSDVPTGNADGETSNMMQPTLRRFICQPVSDDVKLNSAEVNSDNLIPSTLESYAFVPLQGDRQFQHISDDSRVTIDGWEVSLINFIVPCSKTDSSSGDSFLYGVSLVLNLKPDLETSDHVSIQIVSDKNHRITWSKINDKPKLTIYVDSDVESINKELSQNQDISSESTTPCLSVGVALVSHKNVILAMRKSLSRFFEDLTGMGSPTPVQAIASPIVNILKTCRSKGAADTSVLPSLLRPYLDFGHSCISKIMTSSLDQKGLFEKSAIEALVESIPPIPLALLLITTLLEQKIIFTSRRRSNLISMTIALKKLLSPFEWSHLFVPIVPSGLASDLLQYPAPFILGIPFSVGSMALLKSVPDDVTIVDVDVGRVILAKTFSVNFIEQSESIDQTNASTAALRSQVLHLAETLGGVIGSKSSKVLWNCDGPNIDMPFFSNHQEQTKGEALSDVFHSFLQELLAGCNTCCFWIEETARSGDGKTGSEYNILFDEDRFYHVKRLRSEGTYNPLFNDEDYRLLSLQATNNYNDELPKLGTDSSYSLSLDHFNLILDTFLRGQMLSLYLSSKLRPEAMSFW